MGKEKKSELMLTAILLAVGMMGGALVWAHEGHEGKGGKDVTLKGEIVDMACYVPHEGKGKKHADCAKMCVLAGAPIGLLAQDGSVYLLLEDHMSPKAKKPYQAARDLVAEQVSVSGDMYKRSGMAAIVVEKVEKQ